MVVCINISIYNFLVFLVPLEVSEHLIVSSFLILFPWSSHHFALLVISFLFFFFIFPLYSKGVRLSLDVYIAVTDFSPKLSSVVT